MKIGDRVALKEIPENDKFKRFKGIVGEIVNHDNDNPPKFVRVTFDGGKFYEDMLAWRLFLL